MKMKVLFICTHNSARSQMAEGLLMHYHGSEIEAHSAGTEATSVKGQAIKVMNELGYDMYGHRSKSLEEFRGRMFDYVVTVCDSAKEACPFFPGKKVIHREFRDPSDSTGTEEEKMEAFRASRDEIHIWIETEFIPLVRETITKVGEI